MLLVPGCIEPETASTFVTQQPDPRSCVNPASWDSSWSRGSAFPGEPRPLSHDANPSKWDSSAQASAPWRAPPATLGKANEEAASAVAGRAVARRLSPFNGSQGSRLRAIFVAKTDQMADNLPHNPEHPGKDRFDPRCGGDIGENGHVIECPCLG